MNAVPVAASVFVIVLALGRAVRPRSARACAALLIERRAPARTGRSKVRSAVSLGIAAVAVAAVAGSIASAMVVTVALLRPRWRDMQRRRRQAANVDAAFPDFVDLLVLSIRSGCTPVQSIRAMLASAPAATSDAVVAVHRSVADGNRFAEAVAELPRRLGPVARPLADALALADRHGTPLGPILDRLADEARAARRRAAEVSARQLPVRLSFPLVGCTLPSFVLLTIVPLMAGTLSSLPGLSL